MKIETLAVHAGHIIDPNTGAVTSPIHLSTTFERSPDGSFPHGMIYTRSENPNRAELERCLAALECGVEGQGIAVAFGSGSAATSAIFQTLTPGDHVIAPDHCYTGTTHLLQDIYIPWGLQVSFIDMTNLDLVRQGIKPNTRLIWIETPSNPLLRVTNIGAVAEMAHAAGALLVCDNTWATPVLQHPFTFGADLILHSTTKYLGGHSDVLGGAVIAKEDSPFLQRVRQIQQTGGGVPSPFDCWLVLRGIRSLPYRMRGHCENAQKIAEFLSNQPRVAAVHYPGLASHPGHELAAEQMSAPGGMLSFEVVGGREAAFKVAAKVKIFTRATSLGAPESLIEHRASIEGQITRASEGLLRISVGLEHPADLIEDLAQALSD